VEPQAAALGGLSIPEVISGLPQHPGGQPARVLIVDDSDHFRVVARELVERRGFVVVAEASSASAAILAVEVHQPDAALVDIELPDALGGELARYLSAHHPTVRVLVTSAGSDVDGDKLAEEIGAAGFARKSELARIDLGRFWY
jgi:DNA-binding NarL/FixJ family response regulator